MYTELKPWVYVNNLLVRTEEARQQVLAHFAKLGEPIEIREVDQDAQGRYIVPIGDPMEQ